MLLRRNAIENCVFGHKWLCDVSRQKNGCCKDYPRYYAILRQQNIGFWVKNLHILLSITSEFLFVVLKRTCQSLYAVHKGKLSIRGERARGAGIS